LFGCYLLKKFATYAKELESMKNRKVFYLFRKIYFLIVTQLTVNEVN